MGETIEIKIGKKCKAIIIDHTLSNIQAKFGSVTLNKGFLNYLEQCKCPTNIHWKL